MAEKKEFLAKSGLDEASSEDQETDDMKEVHRSKDTETSFLAELRFNKVTRFNVMLSFSVAFAFSLLGWRKGQTGPAFLDIIHIAGTDLERGSAFKAAFFAGNILGIILCGVLYSKINAYLMLTVSLLTNCASLSVIPWCFNYESMLIVHAVNGTSNGVLSVVLTATAVAIWGPTPRGRMYLNIFYASNSALALLSPLVTSPFLSPMATDLTTDVLWSNSSADVAARAESSIPNTSANIYMTVSKPFEYVNVTMDGPSRSSVYIAYSISAGLTLLSTIPFVIFYFKSSKEENKDVVRQKSTFNEKRLPLYMKVFQIVNIGVFSMFYMSILFIFSGYLAAFCVQHLQWTKTSGAFVTSAYYLSMLGGRLFGAYLSQLLKPMKMLVLSTVFHVVGLVGFSVSGVLNFNVGIWISVCVIGMVFSLIWPSFLSWANETLLSVRGKMTTYLILTGFLGAFLSPLLFGYMMEEVSPIWFCFLSVAKALGTVTNVILMCMYTRYIRGLQASE